MSIVLNGTSGITSSTATNVDVTYQPLTATGSALKLTGKDTQGGVGYFDFLNITNTTSGATNPNKFLRLNSTGGIEIINSAYTANIFNLTNAGALSVPGPISISGKQAVNGPAFSAYPAISQSITAGSSLQKVNFSTEEYDTNNNFASSRFTPTVEGYYTLNASVRLDGASGTGENMIVLYKNGTEYKRGFNSSGVQFASNFFSMSVSSTAYANGSTDYFEIYIQHGNAAALTTTAFANISWFNGCMIRGA